MGRQYHHILLKLLCSKKVRQKMLKLSGIAAFLRLSAFAGKHIHRGNVKKPVGYLCLSVYFSKHICK